MPFIEFDGTRFHYELIGSGLAVVFAHGLTGDLNQARQLIGSLGGYRQLFGDVRGHGLTEPLGPPEKLRFSTFATDLAVLMDHLGIGRAVVGGISMGAAIATRFAVDYPKRVLGLVLVRPAWLDRPLPKGLRLFPRVAEYLERFGPDRGLAEFKKLPEFAAVREASIDASENLLAQFRKPHALERRARLRTIPSDAPIKNWDQVRDLDVPAVVFGNEPDWVHPVSYAATWAEKLPQGQFVQIPAKSIDFEEYRKAFRLHFDRFLQSLSDSPTASGMGHRSR